MKYHEIQNSDQFSLITDSQDVKAITENLGIVQFADEITGVLVDFDASIRDTLEPYGDLWLTESAKPWSILALWERPDYFADEIPDELDLQD